MKQKIEIHCGLMRGETSLILCVKQDIGGEAARTSLLVQLAPLRSLQVKPIVFGESGGILESGQWLIFGLISRLVDMLEASIQDRQNVASCKRGDTIIVFCEDLHTFPPRFH